MNNVRNCKSRRQTHANWVTYCYHIDNEKMVYSTSYVVLIHCPEWLKWASGQSHGKSHHGFAVLQNLCCWSFIVTMHRATGYFSPLLARIPFCLIPFPVPFPFSAIFYFRINPACEQKDRPSTSPMRKTSWRRRTNKTHQKTYKTKVYQDRKE